MEEVKCDLVKIQQLGALLTPQAEMAALLDIDELLLQEEMCNRLSPIRKAYMRGLADTAKGLRQQMLDAAFAGSPSAIEQAITALQNCM